MVLVQGGTFTMGRSSGPGDTDELPPHTVTLNSFYIGKYEVTQSDWITVMGTNPSYYSSDTYRPVENVNWYNALIFCNKRSILEGLTPVYTIGGSTNPDDWGAIPTALNPTWDTAIFNQTANGYRLPTEAEWEFAARGATNTPDYIYAGSNTLSAVGWYQANSNGITHPVGQLAPNGLGIYDMSGNVNEWCWDWYSNSYYEVSPVNNPTGPATSSWRMLRSGNWNDFVADMCRVVSRNAVTPYTTTYSNGLRVVRNQN
jgi:formylglycine-generating enzyme required for sulfatase activity